MRLGWRFSWLLSLGLISFLCPPEGGLGPGKVPWPGDFGTTAKEGGGNGASEERPRENGDALTWEGSLGPLPGPSAQPHKGEWGMHSCVLRINSFPHLTPACGQWACSFHLPLMVPTSGPQVSSRRSVCPPSVRRAASSGYPPSKAPRLPGAPQPARAAGVGSLPALPPGRASRSS